MIQAQSSSASGSGSVISKADKENVCVAAGGIVEGKGQIISKDGTVKEFIMKSDPLTQEQADAINQANLDIKEK